LVDDALRSDHAQPIRPDVVVNENLVHRLESFPKTGFLPVPQVC
jgi:hypothetical protein